jgi:hypothetical protein
VVPAVESEVAVFPGGALRGISIKIGQRPYVRSFPLEIRLEYVGGAFEYDELQVQRTDIVIRTDT